jgi:hypothetical protein
VNQTFAKEVADICSIFSEITGAEVLREKEAPALVTFLREFKVSVADMRRIIYYHWHTPKERVFLDEPGNCNLRAIFNSARSQRVFDVLQDLKRVERKIQEDGNENVEIGDYKTNWIICGKCKENVPIRYLKALPKNSLARFSWKSMASEDMQAHLKNCLRTNDIEKLMHGFNNDEKKKG